MVAAAGNPEVYQPRLKSEGTIPNGAFSFFEVLF